MRVLSPDPRDAVIVHTDGAARGNPGPAGIGVVVTRPSGEVVAELAEGIGPATNNVAEYRAAIEGFRLAAKHGATTVTLRADSKLLVEQLAGRFRVKNPTLQRLHEEARREMKRFDEVRLEHVPRARNADADRLANVGIEDWLAGPGRDYAADEPSPPLFDAD